MSWTDTPSRRDFLGAGLAGAALSGGAAPGRSPNVLLLCVDDLRPQLGCYGYAFMKTPNIDRLAREGRRFNRHYVQSAVCGPSRCSMLTGRLFNTWDCWERERTLAAEPGEPVSFAHLFRRNGYRTVGIGKISHQPGGVMDTAQKIPQVPFSWDLTYAPVGAWRTPWRAFFGFAGGEAYNTASLPKQERDSPRLPYEAADVADTGYPDGLHAEEAVKQLRDLKQRGTPFLLAVGFYKPHLPFNAPKRYWDLYRREAPLAPNPFPAANTDPAISLHPSGELTGNHYWPSGRGKVTEDDARALRHGYYACVSYIDAQVGRVLGELKRLGLDRNTIVVLWSDHGWHLGEHGIFGKQTNHEIAVRSPLIIRTPGMKSAGTPANALAETVDIYPTLAELCGLKPPPGLAGSSLVPLLTDPNQPGKHAAFSYHPRGRLMGRTLRTDRYRLVYWTDQQGHPVQTELYDHRNDPQENSNVASTNPGATEELIRRLPPLSAVEKGEALEPRAR